MGHISLSKLFRRWRENTLFAPAPQVPPHPDLGYATRVSLHVKNKLLKIFSFSYS